MNPFVSNGRLFLSLGRITTRLRSYLSPSTSRTSPCQPNSLTGTASRVVVSPDAGTETVSSWCVVSFPLRLRDSSTTLTSRLSPPFCLSVSMYDGLGETPVHRLPNASGLKSISTRLSTSVISCTVTPDGRPTPCRLKCDGSGWSLKFSTLPVSSNSIISRSANDARRSWRSGIVTTCFSPSAGIGSGGTKSTGKPEPGR